jgi:hypothetical protein
MKALEFVGLVLLLGYVPLAVGGVIAGLVEASRRLR